MKSLFLFLVLSTSSFAATGSGNVSNVLTLGGSDNNANLNINESNSQGYFTVYLGGTITAGNFSPFYKDGTAYQVTAGKTFQVVKICLFSDTTVAKEQLVTSTASIAANTAVALTSPKYQGGATTLYTHISSVTTYESRCFNSTWAASASTFIGLQGGTSAVFYVQLLGKEI